MGSRTDLGLGNLGIPIINEIGLGDTFAGNEIDLRYIDNIKQFIGDDSGYNIIEGRDQTSKFRIYNERLAKQRIFYYGGDFIAEDHDKIEEGEAFWETELNSLKRATERNVDVKILCKWESSSPILTNVINEYVDSGIDIRSWNGEIRGGLFDDTVYLVERNFCVPPSELDKYNSEIFPQKIVGKRQKDEHVPLQTIVTKHPETVEFFLTQFNQDFKGAESMDSRIKNAEQKYQGHPMSSRKNNFLF